MRQRADIRSSHCREDHEGQRSARHHARQFAPLHPRLEEHHQRNREQRDQERKRLGEVGESEEEAHGGRVEQAFAGKRLQQHGEGGEHEGLEQRVGPYGRHPELAAGGDDQQPDAEQLQRVLAQKERRAANLRELARICFRPDAEAAAQLCQRRNKRQHRRHRCQKDEVVEHVVGVQLVPARDMKDPLRQRQKSGIQRVPVGIDHARPMMRADQVGDVHVGHAIAVERVGIELHRQPRDRDQQREIDHEGTAQGLRSHRVPRCMGRIMASAAWDWTLSAYPTLPGGRRVVWAINRTAATNCAAL